MTFRIVRPAPGEDPQQAPLDAGMIYVNFNETQWAWFHDVIADAHKEDRITLKPQTLVREAIDQLAQRGGWSVIRDAVVRRRELEPRPGRQRGSKAVR